MKVLILANKLPYPPRDGGSIATLNMIRGLSNAGLQVTCLAMNTSKHPYPVDQIPEELTSAIRFIGVPCDTRIHPLKMAFNLLFSSSPYLAERFKFTDFARAVCRILEEEEFRIVQLEGPYTGHYLKEIRRISGARVVLRAHNVEHRIWQRKSELEPNFLKSKYMKNLAGRLKRFEMDVLSASDGLVAITREDEAQFRELGYDGPAITVPAGLSPGQYKVTPLPRASSLFFIGALDWLPNQEALMWLINRVLDNLRARVPDLEFHIAGRNAPAHFIRRLDHPGITFHGEVPDSRLFMEKYRVMAAPLLTGSGIRIKILEGMAMGRPVVTTFRGMQGIPATPGKELFASDVPDQFAVHAAELLASDRIAESMAERARKLVLHNFDTFELSRRLSRFFRAQV